MPSTIRPARLRHPRHRKFLGLIRGAVAGAPSQDHARLFRMKSYLDAREVVLGATGTGQVFTADFANNEIDIVTHGYVAGNGPFLLTTAGTLPAGLELGVLYWINDTTVSTMTLHRSRQDAVRLENIVPFTDAGTGAHTITPAANVDGLVELQRQNGVSFEQVRDETDIDNLIP